MRRIMLILSAAVMLLTGCTDYRQVRVEEVSLDSFRFKGTSSAVITLEVKVDNPTARTISVESVDAVLLREGKEFVRFTLQEAVHAAPGTESDVLLPVNASVLDPVAIITAGLNFSSWNLEDYVIDGRMTMCADGKMRKTVRLREVPLKDIVNSIKR